jgi:ADP-L-glycero-D-manno-heptose 6-epimerase
MIIVTGAAGFIGSILAQDISRKGKQNLLLVDKFTKPAKWKNLVGMNFTDIMDRDIFLNQLEGGKIKDVELVIHMGACTDTTEFNMDYLMAQNYEYSKRLCSWCINNGVRLIYASSAAVYGDGAKGFSDRDELAFELKPLNPYGFSKLLFDKWVINNGYHKSVVGLRFFNVFGPNEYHKNKMSSVIHRAFPMAKKEGAIKLFKSYVKEIEHGNQKRDFIYVKDIIKVVDFFMSNKNISGIFNLGTGKARSFNDLAASMLKALDKKVVIEYFDMPDEIRDKYQYFTEADDKRLLNAGYTGGFTDLEAAVTDYVQNYLLKPDPYY